MARKKAYTSEDLINLKKNIEQVVPTKLGEFDREKETGKSLNLVAEVKQTPQTPEPTLMEGFISGLKEYNYIYNFYSRGENLHNASKEIGANEFVTADAFSKAIKDHNLTEGEVDNLLSRKLMFMSDLNAGIKSVKEQTQNSEVFQKLSTGEKLLYGGVGILSNLIYIVVFIVLFSSISRFLKIMKRNSQFPKNFKKSL